MLFNKDLLDKIKKRNSVATNILNVIARNQERCAPAINQLNQIFNALPESAKTNTNLVTRLSTHKEETFRGALAEIITNFVLKEFKFETHYEPPIRTPKGIVTPDFYAFKPNRAFITEVFAPCKSESELKRDYNLYKAREKLSSLRSKYRIILVGNPIPDQSGGFKNIDVELLKFLENASPNKEISSLKTKNGAIIRFHFHTKTNKDGPTMTGWYDTEAHTNVFHEKILKTLRSKRKEYKFPFVASCVIMPDIMDADRNTFYRSLVGDQQISIRLPKQGTQEKAEQKPFSTNSYTGFWGFKHNEFHRHHLVQGILVTYVRWEQSGKLKLILEMYENPHFLTDLKKDFRGIPDLLRTKGNPDKKRALIIYPPIK